MICCIQGISQNSCDCILNVYTENLGTHLCLTAGLCPDPLGSYSAPPDPLAVIGGGKGMKGEGKGRKGRGRERR